MKQFPSILTCLKSVSSVLTLCAHRYIQVPSCVLATGYRNIRELCCLISHRTLRIGGFDSRDEGVAPTKVPNALWERSPDRDFEAGRVR
ncbi:hypothetical protein [Methylotuvimicrobium sp. KM1]|uniref:hypothetical protein n=1 Tax=Methylotuvimicrobium sp. KM1 TaxID=3377707 RepID=UPI00384DD552